MKKGKFITFEGIDGCGKSTQVDLLADRLKNQGIDTVAVREPGGTRISESIREILLYRDTNELAERTEALLMTASRAQLTNEVILPALNNGKWVISDRYSDSTLAYQGGGRKITIDWLEKINQFATFNTQPDVTFFIDILPSEGQKRQKSKLDRIEKAGIDLQNETRNVYLMLAEENSNRIITIDGNKNIEQIHEKIWLDVSERLLE